MIIFRQIFKTSSLNGLFALFVGSSFTFSARVDTVEMSKQRKAAEDEGILLLTGEAASCLFSLMYVFILRDEDEPSKRNNGI